MNEKKDIFKEVEKKEENKKTIPNDLSYTEIYDLFMKEMDIKEIDGAEIGEKVAVMVSCFTQNNLIMVRTLKMFNKVKAEILQRADEKTGKPITSSKAEVLANASPEAYAYHKARVDVQNIQEMINALKTLQRGVLFEYNQHQ